MSDFERYNWRWNDLEALRFDHDEAIRKRDEARAFAIATGGLGAARGAAVNPNTYERFARVVGGGLARGAAGWPVAVGVTATSLLPMHDFDMRERRRRRTSAASWN